MATTADGRFIRARVMRAFGVEYRAAEFLSGRAETAVSPIPLVGQTAKSKSSPCT